MNKKDFKNKHGVCKTLHRLYGIYRKMIDRCYNKNSRSYKNYGAIGVRVCKEWLGETYPAVIY